MSAGGGRSRTATRPRCASGNCAGRAGHDRHGGRGAQVDHLRVTGLGQQPGHDPRGARGRLGGEFHLDGPGLPGVAAGRLGGRPADLGVRDVAARPDPGGREGGADVPLAPPPRPGRLRRRARIAATGGRRGPPGRGRGGTATAGGRATCGRSRSCPAGVSQHHAGPGPSTPVTAYPAARQRAVTARTRAGGALSAAASRS